MLNVTVAVEVGVEEPPGKPEGNWPPELDGVGVGFTPTDAVGCKR